MKAYVIGRMKIQSKEWMEEYFSKVPWLIEEHGGRFLVRGGNPDILERTEVLPDATFILEFPSRAHAMKFWGSDAFQPLIKLRQSGSTLEAIIADGL